MVQTDTSAYLKGCKKRRMKSSYKLFICKDLKLKYEEHNNNRDALVFKAARVYGVPVKELAQIKISRTDMGKPFFEDFHIQFSVSHSDNMWTCLMGPGRCGLDIQYIRPCRFEKIAARFFVHCEQEYVKLHGLEGFFDIWTMREAYGKYTGEGFFGDMPEFVGSSGSLVTQAEYGGESLRFVIIPLADNLKCVACIKENVDDDIQIEEV